MVEGHGHEPPAGHDHSHQLGVGVATGHADVRYLVLALAIICAFMAWEQRFGRRGSRPVPREGSGPSG